MAKKNYYTWAKVDEILKHPEILGHLIGKDKWGPIHGKWMRYMYQGQEPKALQAHRGSYKTSCITEMLPLLFLMRNPNERIAIVKKTFTASAESLRNLANIASMPAIAELLEFVWGEKWSLTTNKEGRLGFSTKTTLTKETSIESLSTTSAFTGRHYSIMIFDDIIDIQDRLSEAEREHTKIVVQEMRTNVLDPEGKLIACGTPWHRNDAWECFPPAEKYPVSRTNLLSPLQLADKKATLNPLLYSCNYDLEFMSDEAALFKEPIMGKWRYTGLHNIQALLDTAFDGDHFNALTILGQMEDGKLNGVGFTYPGNVREFMPEIVRKCVQYGVRRLHVEANADKGWTAQILRINAELQKNHVWVRDYDEHTNKHLKICSYGLEAWKSTEWAAETDTNYLEQCMDYMEKALPDDAPDSFASLIREGGYSVTKDYVSKFTKAWAF